MNAKEGLKLVFGSVVVYVAMAACASAGTGTSADMSAGAGSSGGGGSDDGSGSSGGGNGDDSGGGMMSVLDALTDPVPAAKADTTQSGSRLKAKYFVGADGSKTLAGLHDSMLNVDCYFQAATDGKTRCIPASSGVGIGTAGFFADANCTQPLGARVGTCGPAPTYITVSTTDSTACSTTTKTYTVGPRFTGNPYQGTPAACAQISAAYAMSLAASSFSWYSLGAQIPPPDPAQYVQATVQTEP